jgi:hypothetical protein
MSFIIIFLIVGVVVIVTIWQGRLGINLRPVRCSNCATPMSARRRRMFRSHLLLGGWTCPHCGTDMDQWGRRVNSRGRVSDN